MRRASDLYSFCHLYIVFVGHVSVAKETTWEGWMAIHIVVGIHTTYFNFAPQMYDCARHVVYIHTNR